MFQINIDHIRETIENKAREAVANLMSSANKKINLDLVSLLDRHYLTKVVDTRGSGFYHPTDIAAEHFCPWRAAQPRLGVSGESSSFLRTTFELGHVIHKLIQEYLGQIFDSRYYQFEVPVEIPYLRMRGSADVVFQIDGQPVVVDIKSTSLIPSSVPLHYKLQVMCYMLGLNTTNGYILYAIKPKQVETRSDPDKLKFKQFAVEFDPKEFEVIIQRIAFLESMIEANRAEELPRIVGPSTCNLCHYLDKCPEFRKS